MKNHDKNEKIFEAIGFISDDKIEKAAKIEVPEEKPFTIISSWRLFAPIAAAACITLAFALFAMPLLAPDDPVTPSDTDTSAESGVTTGITPTITTPNEIITTPNEITNGTVTTGGLPHIVTASGNDSSAPTTTTGVTDNPSPTIPVWFASYYRTVYDDVQRNPVKIRSAAELQSFYKNNEEYLRANGHSRFINEVAFDTAYYNNAFFADRFLLLITRIEGSGSTFHNVTSVAEQGGKLRVNINQHTGMGTTDMAQWIIAIEICRSLVNLEVETVYTNIQREDYGYDYSQLSPPAKDLASISLVGTDNFFTNVVFRFNGAHSAFNFGQFDTYKLTRNGVELDWDDWGLGGGEIQRVRGANHTDFYLTISLFPPKAGNYVFSGSYGGIPFEAKATLTARGSSPHEQLGLGGLTTANVSRIEFSQYGDFGGSNWEQRFLKTSDKALIGEVLSYFQGIRGEQQDIDHNANPPTNEYLNLTVRFVMTNTSSVEIYINPRYNLCYSSVSMSDGWWVYRLRNAKTPADWAEILAKCDAN